MAYENCDSDATVVIAAAHAFGAGVVALVLNR